MRVRLFRPAFSQRAVSRFCKMADPALVLRVASRALSRSADANVAPAAVKAAVVAICAY